MARKLETLKSHAKLDTQLAASLVTAGLLSDEGLQSMAQVLQGANDPVQAIAHVIFMALDKVREKLEQNKMQIDPRVWIAGGGVLDRVIFEVMGALYAIVGFKDAANSQFVHNVKGAVLDLMHDDEEQNPNEPEPDNDVDDSQQQPPSGGLAAPMGGMQ